MTDITSTPESSPRPKRSWRSFTLRALFFVVLVASIFFGWVAYRVRHFHEQAAFISDLRSKGFAIETEAVPDAWFWAPLVGDDAIQVRSAILRGVNPTNVFFGPTHADLKGIAAWTTIKALWLYGAEVTDETFAVVSTFRDLSSLMLYQTAISDAALQQLTALEKLRVLKVDNSKIEQNVHGPFTRAAAEHISKIKHLIKLDLNGIPIGDEGIQLLSLNLPTLQELSLVNCSVTDRGLTHLSDMTTLTRVGLSHNPDVTDVGLRYLYRLRSLKVADMRFTGITRRGVEECRFAMPSVVVAYESD